MLYERRFVWNIIDESLVNNFIKQLEFQFLGDELVDY